MKKITALLTACSPLVLLAQAAHAQTQPADSNIDNLIEEVVVTATRRSQSLSEVPIAVSVVTKADIQNSGTYDVKELNQLSPSVLISSTGSESNTSARIRGIGTVGDNIGLESSVAIFVDGVYRSRTGVGMGELGDIQQIEVLRGPQGTLFGRNASAGLINITTAPPTQEFASDISVTYGNYDQQRLEASINGGLSDTVAGKLEGIFYKRDGFYEDVNTGYELNNRDRYFLRGQLMIEPQDNLSLRIIGDYTKQNEDCCGAVFATDDISDHTDDIQPLTNSQLLDPVYNPNIGILMAVTGKSLDELYPSMDDPYDRKMAISPGRDYGGTSEQWGLSAELNWTINDMTFTSITAYRDYDSAQSADAEYHYADILSISENGSGRQFETFSQEFRLQGTAFNDRLDWLAGAYYSNETLQQGSTLQLGSDYGAYTSCLLAASLGTAFMDASSSGCLNPTGRFVANSLSPDTLQAFDLLYSLQNLGDDGSRYQQDSETFALFTHNIVKLTDTLDLTVGLRYTYDEKRFDADFNNTNTVCADMRSLSPGIFPMLSPAFLTLACQGNSTSELNALDLKDSDSTEQFTGTLVLSWRPSDDWMFYGSYSRGYKAGGYNLDRSALGPAYLSRSNSDVDNLKFDPEIVDAFEVGAKYQGERLTASAALFYQSFENFQLNTFDGTVYIVETINGCDSNLNGLDTDTSPVSGACDSGDVTYGVISEGIELEASYSATSTLNLMAGVTYANTRYADDLVGDDSGSPLNPSLRRLPGEPLSNAPDLVTTAAISWTPKLTDDLSGLLYLNVRYSDSYNTGSNLAAQKIQDAYSVVNGRLGIVSQAHKWSLELWGKNLLNEEYAQVIFDTAFIGSSTSYLADPRSYGVTLRKSF
ncbi:TonB-dependent receptor [Aestuariicella sp. G3-2]|uniref:TonB-dependent receptor n=1 Tax=Pseudomaricurvus albidus TaxID=2842452 RepID=UPI001C0D9D13|nr:TonB-dependent receptor [Aestuariicella albida]MBU3068691.1 TonB-dependent receptor [Aestuariicella albida]